MKTSCVKRFNGFTPSETLLKTENLKVKDLYEPYIKPAVKQRGEDIAGKKTDREFLTYSFGTVEKGKNESV